MLDNWWVGLACIAGGLGVLLAVAIIVIGGQGDEWESVEEFSEFRAALGRGR